MAYTAQTWADGPIGNTPISSGPLNHMEAGILDASNRLDAIGGAGSAKPSVIAASTINLGALAGAQTVDGVALTAGQRVLLAGQTTAPQNGIWVVQSGAWTRPADFATGSTQQGAVTFVEAGTANGSSGWLMSGSTAVTVDTTAQTWVQFSGAAQITAGAYLAKAGNTLSAVAGTASGTVAAGNDARITGAIQSGAAASGDLGGTLPSPTVVATHLASPLPFAQGGTGSGTQNFVDLTTPQTVAGVKTFSSAPTVPAAAFPESAVANLTTDLAAKATDTAVVHLAGTETIAGAKTFTAAPTVPAASFPESAVTSLTADLAARLVAANNLSDLSNAGTARTNLGLGTGSTAAIDTTATDIAALGTQAAGATGKLADAGHVHQMPRLDQVAAPTAAVALNTQKITGLANGTAATDGAAFGQIPVAGTGAANYTAGNATVAGDLAGTLPNPTVANIGGVAIPASPAAVLLAALAGPPVFSETFQGTVGANADTTTTNYTSSPGGSSNNFAGATAVFAAAGADGFSRCGKVSIPAGAGAFAFLGTGISPSRSLLYLRQYVQVPTLASSPVPIVTLKNGGINGTHLGRIQVSSTGTGSHVQLLDGSDAVAATSTLAVVAGAWIRLEWKANPAGSTQTLKIYTGTNLHTTTVTETLTAAMGSSNIDYLEHGPTSNPVTPATFSILYDEILVLADGYPGPLLRAWVYSGT